MAEFRREEPQHESSRPLRSLRLNVISAPAHERAPPHLALRLWLSRAGGMRMEGGEIREIGEMLQQRHGTRMPRIGRMFTDIFDPCASASSAQSVFDRIPPRIDDDKKPQINADERRYVHVTGFDEIIHRKGRKERRSMKQEFLCPLCSLWLNTSSAPTHERAPPAVHLRLSGVGDILFWREKYNDIY